MIVSTLGIGVHMRHIHVRRVRVHSVEVLILLDAANSGERFLFWDGIFIV
jgi:hypothetical protein